MEWKIFETIGVRPRIGTLGELNGFKVLVSILTEINGPRSGFLFASAAGRHESDVIEALYLNQRRNLTVAKIILGQDNTNFPAPSDLTEPSAHRLYYMNPDRTHDWEWILTNTRLMPNLEPVEILVQDLALPFDTPWPLFAARAVSPDLQGYFIGLPRPEALNPKRLELFGIQNGKLIINEPHPLP